MDLREVLSIVRGGRRCKEPPAPSVASAVEPAQSLSSLVRGVASTCQKFVGPRRRRFSNPSHKAEHMRLKGEVNRLRKTGSGIVAGHVDAKITAANSKAKTATQLVDVTERRPRKIFGRGQYKKWLPPAILRVCFGSNFIAKSRRRAAGSMRGLADFYEASHSHIRRLRCCIAAAVLQMQRACLMALPFMQHAVWVVCFDETEMLFCNEQSEFSASNERKHMLMVHFILHARFALGTALRRKEIVTSPAILQNMKATTILNALSQRAPMSVVNLASKTKRLCVVFCTDAANTCKSVAYHQVGKLLQLRANPDMSHLKIYMVHVFCLMHQICLAINAVLAPLFLINPLYCSIVLLTSAGNKAALEEEVTKLCETLHVTSDSRHAPSEQSKKYGRALLRLLEWGDEELRSGTRSEKARQRQAARDQLADFIVWEKGVWRHYCTYGCCKSSMEAKAKAKVLIEAVFFSCIPSAPAKNRWTKLFPPICWFAVFCWLPKRMLWKVFQGVKGNEYTTGDVGDIPVTAEDLAGLEESEAFQRREGVRWKKARNWQENRLTPLRLLLATMMLQPIVSLLGAFFTDAIASGSQSLGMMHFLHETTSPAVMTLNRYFEIMTDLNAPFWLPLTFWTGWTDVLLSQAFALLCIAVGQIWLRLYWTFQRWPWLFGKYYHPRCTLEEKEDIKRSFNGSNACCFDPGLGRALNDEFDKADALFGNPEVGQFLGDSFRSMPQHNMHSEFRFARSQNYIRSCHQKVPGASTVFAKHVLQETQMQHVTSVKDSLDKQPSLRAAVDAMTTKAMSKNSIKEGCWQAFVAAEHKRDFKELGQEWKTICDAGPAERKRRAPGRSAVTPPAGTLQAAKSALLNTQASHLCSGDLLYPVSNGEVSACTRDVLATSQQWQSTVSPAIPEPDEQELKPSLRLCKDFWGPRCKRCMRPQQRRYMKQVIDVCASMQVMNTKKRDIHSWELLPLPLVFEIRGSQPDQQKIVLALDHIQLPDRGVFAACTAMSSAPLMPGDAITARFRMGAMIESKDLANDLLNMSNPITVKSIEYKFRTATNK